MPHININITNYDNQQVNSGKDDEDNNFFDATSYGLWIVCWAVLMFVCCLGIACYKACAERNSRIYELRRKQMIVDKKLNEFNKNKFNFFSDIECSICCLIFDNQDAIILDCCDNYFHNECIKDWYLKSANKDCPLCRNPI